MYPYTLQNCRVKCFEEMNHVKHANKRVQAICTLACFDSRRCVKIKETYSTYPSIVLESSSMCFPMLQDISKGEHFQKKHFLSSCSSLMWNVIGDSQTCLVQILTFRCTKAPPLNIWVSHTMWLGYSCWQVNQARFQWEIQGRAKK